MDEIMSSSMSGKPGPRSPKALAAAAARKEREQGLRDHFAYQLNTLRIKKGWNLSELARRAGLDRSTIGNYAKAKSKPRPEHLGPIAAALDVPPEQLMPQAPDGPRAVAYALPPGAAGAFRMETLPSGKVLLQLHREVTMATAAEIMRLLQQD
jgi:transcriptional regulator with XRE-family HTH domain